MNMISRVWPYKSSTGILHLGYWLSAGAALFFIFSNLGYAIQLRVFLVALLLLVSYFSTRLINRVLVPRLLFLGRVRLFFYSIFGLFCITLWLILLFLIMSILIGIQLQPDLKIPLRNEVVILIFTNYLIVIFASVVHFVKKSQEHSLQKSQLELEKAELSLLLKNVQKQLLQSQLHPHFIFNMLNGLYALSSKENPQLRKIILELSALLEYMLYDCRAPKVGLEAEITFLKNYINLERIRFAEDLSVLFENRVQMGDIKIAPLILFPFVENAFKHGLKRDSSEGFVNITVKGQEKDLEFEVVNNIGKPIVGEQPSGIGLENIKKRLALLYPDRHTLEISWTTSEFRVLLHLSLKENNGEF